MKFVNSGVIFHILAKLLSSYKLVIFLELNEIRYDFRKIKIVQILMNLRNGSKNKLYAYIYNTKLLKF